MTQILKPEEMTEEDIKHLYITPAIEKQWDRTLITMETAITDGTINIQGNKPVREKPKKVDYLLLIH